MDSPRKKVAYDPDQDPEEKRVLRQKYRVLLKDEEGISHHFRSPLYKEQKRKIISAWSSTPIQCQ